MSETRRVDVGEVTLDVTFDDLGTERVSVLLMGAAMQATAWEQAFVDALVDAGIGAIRFDWRDIGRSTWRSFRDHPYTIHTLVDDVFAVADALSVEHLDIVGFSMGGCVAQLAALAKTDRARTLSLLSSGFASHIDVDRGPRGKGLFELFRLPRPTDDAELESRLMEQWRLLCGKEFDFDEQEWTERARAWIERGQNPSCPHIRLRDEVFGVDRAGALSKLHVPTLVLHGTDDPMFPDAHGRALAATLPNSELELFEGRGHDLHLDPGVARRVAAHIASH